MPTSRSHRRHGLIHDFSLERNLFYYKHWFSTELAAVGDVRVRRDDLPEGNSLWFYRCMQTEREREAQEFRAQGGQKAQEIRSKADREAVVIIADANSTAEQTRGVGDAERNRLFAEAYGKDPDFFAFYRSMSAYETGLRSNDTRFLLRPDSEFFRFFANPSGHPPVAAAPKP